MQSEATLRFARITPRKVRVLVDLCKGLPVEDAKVQLKYSWKRGGKILSQLINSAVSNLETQGGIERENMYVKHVVIDQGPMIKRFLPRAMGRATKIQKKMSHIKVIVSEMR